MRFLNAALLLVHVFVIPSFVVCAAVNRHDSDRPEETVVINLLEALNEGTHVKENLHMDPNQAEKHYYYDEEDDDELSADYEFPRVEFSSKPKDPSTILNAERSEGKRKKASGKRKGKGRKRNPCLKKYKDFCIHGTCQYLKGTRGPSCICDPGYSGERCHFFSLLVKSHGGYDRTTALAVIAVLLCTSLCLTIIGILLVLRFHKRGGYNVKNEEKVTLGTDTHH